MIRKLNDNAPKIHPTAFVSEGAYVVGDVEIGEGSGIWPGTVIRGNYHKIAISHHVNIQDNCIIHNDSDAYYGEYVTLGHGVLCHAKTVGAYTLIGNGAVVNGDAVIGDHCVIAAGSVILERAEIPSGSMVIGIPPNQVIRPANERQQGMSERIATGYARNAQIFKTNGLGDPDSAQYAYEGPIPSTAPAAE
ncbi:MAG: gamma carbonic anhydrase family protein [Chloroflexi bacterium]|nr:gamma carbonic anhydrase family protein [Chloroflexota bacterium]